MIKTGFWQSASIPMVRIMSIIPTVDGERKPEYNRIVNMGDEVTDAEIGETIGDCLRNLQRDGAFIGDNLIELNVRFS